MHLAIDYWMISWHCTQGEFTAPFYCFINSGEKHAKVSKLYIIKFSYNERSKFLILYLRYKRDLRNMSRFIEYIVYTIKQDFIERLSGIPQFSKFSICAKDFKFSKQGFQNMYSHDNEPVIVMWYDFYVAYTC